MLFTISLILPILGTFLILTTTYSENKDTSEKLESTFCTRKWLNQLKDYINVILRHINYNLVKTKIIGLITSFINFFISLIVFMFFICLSLFDKWLIFYRRDPGVVMSFTCFYLYLAVFVAISKDLHVIYHFVALNYCLISLLLLYKYKCTYFKNNDLLFNILFYLCVLVFVVSSLYIVYTSLNLIIEFMINIYKVIINKGKNPQSSGWGGNSPSSGSGGSAGPSGSGGNSEPEEWPGDRYRKGVRKKRPKREREDRKYYTNQQENKRRSLKRAINNYDIEGKAFIDKHNAIFKTTDPITRAKAIATMSEQCDSFSIYTQFMYDKLGNLRSLDADVRALGYHGGKELNKQIEKVVSDRVKNMDGIIREATQELKDLTNKD